MKQLEIPLRQVFFMKIMAKDNTTKTNTLLDDVTSKYIFKLCKVMDKRQKRSDRKFV